MYATFDLSNPSDNRNVLFPAMDLSVLGNMQRTADFETLYYNPTNAAYQRKDFWDFINTQVYQNISKHLDDFVSDETDSEEKIKDKNLEDRMELLIRKHTQGTLNPEMNLRLKMLNQRIKELFPVVTESDYSGLEEIISETKKITDREQAIRKNFNLE